MTTSGRFRPELWLLVVDETALISNVIFGDAWKNGRSAKLHHFGRLNKIFYRLLCKTLVIRS